MSSRSRPSPRPFKVGEAIRHVLARLLAEGDVREPALAGALITVTEVRMSPDLRHATAFVLPLGGGDPRPLLDALGRATPELRAKIAAEVRLRYAPELHFQSDTSFDQASALERAFAQARAADGRPEPAAETDQTQQGEGEAR